MYPIVFKLWMFWELEASPVAWTSFMKGLGKNLLHFLHREKFITSFDPQIFWNEIFFNIFGH